MKVRTEEVTELSSSKDEPESSDSFQLRLQELVRIAGSANALAKLSGISQSGIQRYLKGGEPTRKMLITLAQCTGVSLLWLMTGQGETFSKQLAVQDSLLDEDIYAYIPLYDAHCSAGYGSWNERCRVLVNLSFTRYSLRKKGLRPNNLVCLRVNGDSMSGLLEDGDTVMIDLSRSALEWEGIYVVLLDEHLYAKRLQRDFDGSVRIVSHNREYRDVIVPKDRLAELHIIGRVVWAGGWI